MLTSKYTPFFQKGVYFEAEFWGKILRCIFWSSIFEGVMGVLEGVYFEAKNVLEKKGVYFEAPKFKRCIFWSKFKKGVYFEARFSKRCIFWSKIQKGVYFEIRISEGVYFEAGDPKGVYFEIHSYYYYHTGEVMIGIYSCSRYGTNYTPKV